MAGVCKQQADSKIQKCEISIYQTRSRTGDSAPCDKTNNNCVYFIRQGSGKVLLFEIEVANLAVKPGLTTRFLHSHDLGVNASRRQIP
jgi:hypothetical protein